MMSTLTFVQKEIGTDSSPSFDPNFEKLFELEELHSLREFEQGPPLELGSNLNPENALRSDIESTMDSWGFMRGDFNDDDEVFKYEDFDDDFDEDFEELPDDEFEDYPDPYREDEEEAEEEEPDDEELLPDDMVEIDPFDDFDDLDSDENTFVDDDEEL